MNMVNSGAIHKATGSWPFKFRARLHLIISVNAAMTLAILLCSKNGSHSTLVCNPILERLHWFQ